jgi:hypothetical protein
MARPTPTRLEGTAPWVQRAMLAAADKAERRRIVEATGQQARHQPITRRVPAQGQGQDRDTEAPRTCSCPDWWQHREGGCMPGSKAPASPAAVQRLQERFAARRSD